MKKHYNKITKKDYESELINIYGNKNLSYRRYTEKHSNIKMTLYYHNGNHVGTWSADKNCLIWIRDNRRRNNGKKI